MPKGRFVRYVLITGATDGIGRQLAYELASNVDENFVIVHGRSAKKCEETVNWLNNENKSKNTTANSHANVDFLAADFAKLSEVARIAEEIRLRFPKLNGLISCASTLANRKTKSIDGLELTVQVNHLAHVLLWDELLPLLEQNSPSRILTVGSMLHNFSIDWADMMCERGHYDKYTQYSRSMLMNHLATLYIHRLLFKHKKQFQVTANVVDAEHRIEKQGQSFAGRFYPYADFHQHLSASETYLYEHKNAITTLVGLTVQREFAGISGKYYDANGKEQKLGADVSDTRIQDKLWKESILLCNSVLGRKTAIDNSTGIIKA